MKRLAYRLMLVLLIPAFVLGAVGAAVLMIPGMAWGCWLEFWREAGYV